MTQVHTTPKSGNKKTGPMIVTTSEAATCPDACPFNHNNEGGCLAEYGPLKLHWDKVSKRERGGTWEDFIANVGTFATDASWRHNQAGDMPGDKKNLDERKCYQLADANDERDGFTYCHYDVIDNEHNRKVLTVVNQSNFTVNLSGNNMAHADQLVETKAGPVCTVLPKELGRRKEKGEWTETLADYRVRIKDLKTPAGNPVGPCPATYLDDLSCLDCMLCAKKQRKILVGFPAHGTGARKADAVATNLRSA